MTNINSTASYTPAQPTVSGSTSTTLSSADLSSVDRADLAEPQPLPESIRRGLKNLLRQRSKLETDLDETLKRLSPLEQKAVRKLARSISITAKSDAAISLLYGAALSDLRIHSQALGIQNVFEYAVEFTDDVIRRALVAPDEVDWEDISEANSHLLNARIEFEKIPAHMRENVEVGRQQLKNKKTATISDHV